MPPVVAPKADVMRSMVLLLHDAHQYRGSLPIQLCYAHAACRLGVETGVMFETQPKPSQTKTPPAGEAS